MTATVGINLATFAGAIGKRMSTMAGNRTVGPDDPEPGPGAVGWYARLADPIIPGDSWLPSRAGDAAHATVVQRVEVKVYPERGDITRFGITQALSAIAHHLSAAHIASTDGSITANAMSVQIEIDSVPDTQPPAARTGAVVIGYRVTQASGAPAITIAV